ncbi:hypothetical protein AGMMS4957_18190 [Bacteroidia bacterium]|nr:hypothetical protein AGMMS4957_18190 [Bacteroidia bacterium]
MKVILLTDQLIQSKDTFIVGGWMQSLIQVLQNSTTLEVAVVGLTQGDACVEKEHNITWYKVKERIYNPFERVYRRWRCTIQDNGVIEDYVTAIQDFKPGIVHIFGVENFLCSVIPHIDSKVVVHLQGLIHPYLNAYFPPGISEDLFARQSFHLGTCLRGAGQRQCHKMFQALGKRESAYFRSIRFVMGRTHWDKAIAAALAKDAHYFHLDEVLRPDFYAAEAWQPKQREVAQFISILSPSTYKGFDVILKTASLLVSRGIRFQWTVCGTSEADIIVRTMEKILQKKYSQNNVSFLGRQTAPELVSRLLDADIFIHPSYIENSPNSVCEAQILGLPVVVSYVGGIPSLVENEKTGILFPANDIYFLSETIVSLLSEPQKMQLLGQKAREVARQRHDRDAILKGIEHIYKQILQS